MKKLLFALMAIIILLLLFPASALSVSPLPLPSIIPHPTLLPLDPVVNIPDAALHSALHTKTGVPASSEIHRSDLEALTGSLWLDGLGIFNAEGIQYCKNITGLDMFNNNLTSMPDMSGMTKLKYLYLYENDFPSVPSGTFGIPGLTDLNIHSNPIETVGTNIANLTTLRSLDLTDCKLTSFPTAIQHMNIEVLWLAGNDIGSVPSVITGMTHLRELNLRDTGLDSLPDLLGSMPSLQFLVVSGNNLYSLPDNIGSGNLKSLNASNNRLTSLPESIGDSAHLYHLDVMINRLTALPSNFSDKDYDFINLEFNFMDVSPGSPARTIINNTASIEKDYKRQLTPVQGLEAVPAADSVALSWDACPNGSGGGATWKVDSYVVYLYTGEMVKIDDVDKTVTSYTHTGLTPETEYDYRVGVNYEIDYPAYSSDKIDIRGYTQIKTTTLAAASPSESASESPSAEVSTEASPTVSEQASSPAVSSGADASAVPASGPSAGGFPLWAGIAIALLGAAAIASGIILAVKAKKPKT